MSEAKDHHYVPECYLKSFTKDGFFYALKLPSIYKGYKAYPKTVTPAQVCYFSNYYKLEKELLEEFRHWGEFDNLYIENKILHKAETQYPRILINILCNRALNLSDAITLSDFIIQLKIRSPFWRDVILPRRKNEHLTEAGHQILSDILEKNAYPSIPDSLKKHLVQNKIDSQIGNPNFAKQQQLFGLIARSQASDSKSLITRDAILKYKWYLLCTPDPEYGFITTDNPGFALNQQMQVLHTKFGGVFQFYVPLTPSFCMFFSNVDIDLDFKKLRRSKVFKSIIVSRSDIEAINRNSLKIAFNHAIGLNLTCLKNISREDLGQHYELLK